MKKLPTITVIGSGYAGITSATIFANPGYKVYAVEINSKRLDATKADRLFFYEDHITPLLEKGD